MILFKINPVTQFEEQYYDGRKVDFEQVWLSLCNTNVSEISLREHQNS